MSFNTDLQVVLLMLLYLLLLLHLLHLHHRKLLINVYCKQSNRLIINY